MTSVLLQPRCQGIDGIGLSVLRDHTVVAEARYDWESQYVGYNYGTHSYAIEAAWAAGLPLIPNVEAEPDAAKGGYPKGKVMAEKAIVDLERLGFLGECPVPFSAADKWFADLLGAGLDYHRALVDVFGGHGWVGGAYGFKALMEPLSQQSWWPDDWPIWHWGGDYDTIYDWAWAKQWYGRTPTWVYDPPIEPHPNVGFGIDENTLMKPMRFWSGYGSDVPPDPVEDDVAEIVQTPNGMIWSCVTAPDGHPALIDTGDEGWYVYGVLGYDVKPIRRLDQSTADSARYLSHEQWDALARKYGGSGGTSANEVADEMARRLARDA
jgi:hypothetical protein